MEIKVQSDYTSVNLHVGDDTTTQVKGYPKRADGDDGRQYGNPAFVSLEIAEGDWGRNKQVLKLFLSPSQTDELRNKLAQAAAVARGDMVE